MKKEQTYTCLYGRNAHGRPKKEKQEVIESYSIPLFFESQKIKNVKQK